MSERLPARAVSGGSETSRDTRPPPLSLSPERKQKLEAIMKGDSDHHSRETAVAVAAPGRVLAQTSTTIGFAAAAAPSPPRAKRAAEVAAAAAVAEAAAAASPSPPAAKRQRVGRKPKNPKKATPTMWVGAEEVAARADEPVAAAGGGEAHHAPAPSKIMSYFRREMPPHAAAAAAAAATSPSPPRAGGAARETAAMVLSGARRKEQELERREQELVRREQELAAAQRREAETERSANDALREELERVGREAAGRDERSRAMLIELARQACAAEKAQQQSQLLHDQAKVGRIVQRREGHMVNSYFEEGQLFVEARNEIRRLKDDADSISAQKKEITKRRRSLKRESGGDSQHGSSSSSSSSSDNASQQAAAGPAPGAGGGGGPASSSPPSSSSPGEFVPPAALSSGDKLSEQDEVLKMRLFVNKRDTAEAHARLEDLEARKKQLVRTLRRMEDERRSRFNHNPVLNERYLLLRLLGKGGFSEVYKALDLREHRYVACKIHQLNPQWSDDRKRNYTRHATREYNIHRSLQHRRVVQLFDVFAIDINSFCTVLEYCNGPDLDMHLKTRKVLPEREARGIIMQVFSGLLYLNSQKQRVIHYDLKPANILFHNGEAKITDFGLSKIMAEETGAEGIELTSQGAGTYWYLPPECFATGGARISSKVDVWSCGVILYEMLTGCRPFGHGQTQEAIVSENVIARATQVSFPAKPAVSAPTKAFIRRCLTHSVRARPDIPDIVRDPYLGLLPPSAAGGGEA